MAGGATLSLAAHAFEEDFRKVERSDPHWAFIHLAACMAWLFAMALSNAAEGICFGILAFVSAIRLPSTGRLYAPLLRTGVVLVFLAFLAWQAASVSWSINPAVRWSAGLPRMALVPFMLWPLSHRAAWIAGAVAAGGTASALALIALNVRSDGIAQYGEARMVGKGLGMAATSISMGVVMLVLGARDRGLASRASRVAAGAAMLGGLAVIAKRAEFVAIPAAIVTGAAQRLAIHRTRGAARRLVMAGAAIVACAALLIGLVPRARETAVSALDMARNGTLGARQLGELSGLRATILQIAFEMGKERPIAGWGAGAFEIQAGERCIDIHRREGTSPVTCDEIAALKTSHNMFADEFCMRGLVGCALLAILLATLGRWAWRDVASPAAIGLLVLWCVHGMINGTTIRGTHLACLGLIVFRCAFVQASQRR